MIFCISLLQAKMQIDSMENLGTGAYGRPQSSTSLSPPTSGLVVPQPLNPRLPQNMLGGQLGVSGRKYPCKMCPQVSIQTSPLSLVQLQRCSALIGRELQSVACASNLMP